MIDDTAFIEYADTVFFNCLPDLFEALMSYCREFDIDPEGYEVIEFEVVDRRKIMQTLQYVPLESGDE